MKKIMSLLLLALVLCQCNPTKSKKQPATPYDLHPEKFTTEYISQSAQKLIDYVPDHAFDPSIKPAFSEDYFKLLEEAWAIPVNDLMGIGENEWLFYFMTGNGDCECTSHPKTILEATKVDDYNSYVKMNYIHQDHDIVMHFENDDWVIDNFDGTKDELIRYINDQRELLRSIDWPSYTQEMVEEMKEYMPEDEIIAWVDEFNAEVNVYFAKYPDK